MLSNSIAKVTLTFFKPEKVSVPFIFFKNQGREIVPAQKNQCAIRPDSFVCFMSSNLIVRVT